MNLSPAVAMPLNILVVEDNDDLREATAEALSTQGHHVRGVDCAEAVPEQAQVGSIDLMVIDLNLPGEDGVSLARRMREVQPTMGIIMLTARSRSEDKATGYASGADIYLTKPASLAELNAAVQSLARRLVPHRHGADTVQLNVRRQTLTGEQGAVALTANEVALLVALARAAKHQLEHWQLVEIMGKDGAEYSKAALEVHIVRLRKKVQQTCLEPNPIRAVRGFGYRLHVDLSVD